MVRNKKITVNDIAIGVASQDDGDYLCLTDITKGYENGGALIENWLRNKNTIEFLGIWEQLNNSYFKTLEFEGILQQTGLNRFHMSVKSWVEKTSATGIYSKSGRHGGTFAHKDVAFHFANWISPVFHLYMITEYQRLKEIETNEFNLEWNVRRIVAKANYKIHTEAVKTHVIPKSALPASKTGIAYANEADLLNVAVFGATAQEWREANPHLHNRGQNVRDTASINELAVLSNLESMNSELIKSGIEKSDRLGRLIQIAKEQLKILNETNDMLQSVKRMDETTYLTTK